MKRLALVLVAAFACRSNNHEPVDDRPAKAEEPARPISTAHGIRVETDARFDLICIVMRLAGAPEYVGSKTAYAAEVDKQFAAFARHPAVVTARGLMKRGIGFDAPMHLAAQLDDNLALRPGGAAELVRIDKRWTGIDVAAYAGELRAFREASKFTAFYSGQSGYRALVQTALAKLVDGARAVPWFDSVFGPSTARFQVVPGLLTGSRNYGTRATAADGVEDRYQVLGMERADGMPVIDDSTLALLVHEMAHSYINPMFESRRGELEAAGKRIYPLVEQRMLQQHYGDWMTMLNESGVRAITVLFMLERKGTEIGARAARNELRTGFLWINELVDVIRKRDHGKPLVEAMPKVVAFFDALATQYAATGIPALQFLGPVDAVFVNPVFIVPAGTDALVTYARRIHDQLFPKAPFIVSSDHILVEQPNQNLVAYGTPINNPLIVNMLAHARIQLAAGKIAIGTKVFNGQGLVLIFTRFRHDDPAHGVAIYAAATDDDLVGINGITHGSRDWLVAKKTADRFEVLDSGDFPRAADGAWMLP